MATESRTIYASWDEYLDALAALPQHSAIGGREWAGGAPTLAEALPLARAGWPEGMALVRSVSLPILSALTDHAQTVGDWTFDVTGADYDVGEYLSGAPECWLAREPSTERPCVTLSVHTGSAGIVPHAAIQNRGAAIVALTLALQGAGYAVKVYGVDGGTVSDEPHDVWTRTTLSDDNGGPLDADRLLFALAHPAATRTLAYSHRIAKSHHAASHAREPSLHHPTTGAQPPLPVGWTTDLHLSRLMPDDADWSSPAAVEAWVTATFDRLTGRAVASS
jgi:hypothetical protein